jgi:hypothetical protein
MSFEKNYDYPKIGDPNEIIRDFAFSVDRPELNYQDV